MSKKKKEEEEEEQKMIDFEVPLKSQGIKIRMWSEGDPQ